MEEQKKVYTFSEEYKSLGFDDSIYPLIDLEDVLNKEIIIEDYNLIDDQFGTKSAIIAFSLENKKHQTICGSMVVVKQLGRIKEDKKFPIKTKITKKESKKSKREYYSLS